MEITKTNWSAGHIMNSWLDEKNCIITDPKVTIEPLKFYYVRFNHTLENSLGSRILAEDTIKFFTRDEEREFVADINNDELDLEFLEKYQLPIWFTTTN